MRSSLVCIFLVFEVALGALPSPERSYKILMLVPLSPRSHRNVFIPLGNALAERGHEVSMLTGYPLEDSKIHSYQHSMFSDPRVKQYHWDNQNMFDASKDTMLLMRNMEKCNAFYNEHFYKQDVVKELYARKDEFDLFIVDRIMNEIVYPFAFNKTHISISTEGLSFRTSAQFGNFVNPAYSSNMLFPLPQPYTFFNRLMNVLTNFFEEVLIRYQIDTPAWQAIARTFPDLPYAEEIGLNQSLVFITGHSSYSDIVPLLPGQVEVGCMHCRPGKPVPEDLERFLAGNTPVVYMSLGSIARSTWMPEDYKKIILRVFAKLPYKFLWKYEDDTLGELPDNVMIKNWMPQQDVLAHKNVRIFISHCGLQGSQESLYHATPILGMPLIGDQKRNIMKWVGKGIGRAVHWDDLSEESLTDAINDLMTNPKYHEKVFAISAAIRDQPESPVDRAVYWTEYVIRHNGAVHLRSPELDLSWIQLLHLDILFLFHLMVFLIVFFAKKIFRRETRKVKVKTN